MKVIRCEQRSPEWYAARIGRPTASGFDQIVTTDGSRSKQAEKYMYRLACERVTGTSEETFKSSAMERGIILEKEAREAYQFITGNEVEEVGLCVSDCGLYACSPDGLMKNRGLEIKCPIASTIVKYKLDRQALVKEYWQQVQGGLLVTGFPVWDLVAYYPGLTPVIVSVEPDKVFLSRLRAELELFCAELEETINKIK